MPSRILKPLLLNTLGIKIYGNYNITDEIKKLIEEGKITGCLDENLLYNTVKYKKEILEIRKQFTPANCAITRICGCYVNHEKEKICQSKQAFLSMPEEEAYKYFDIFPYFSS